MGSRGAIFPPPALASSARDLLQPPSISTTGHAASPLLGERPISIERRRAVGSVLKATAFGGSPSSTDAPAARGE